MPKEESKTSPIKETKSPIEKEITEPKSNKETTEQQEEHPTDQEVTLFVSKLDAGVALLLTPSYHLIEFPALLLPPSTKPSTYIRLKASLCEDAQQKRLSDFLQLQKQILSIYE